MALSATPATPSAPESAVEPLRRLLATPGRHRALPVLPVLPGLAPEVVTGVRDIAVARLRACGDSGALRAAVRPGQGAGVGPPGRKRSTPTMWRTLTGRTMTATRRSPGMIHS
ncbi:hypothetical protein GCM10018784_72320 [Streptomyces hydrogenans]|nr:hypothetical protein GCM10018784_72320 [Streptomyces hydrogenans]